MRAVSAKKARARRQRPAYVDRSHGRGQPPARVCVCCGRWAQLHHRRMRSQGGTDDTPNLIPVCPELHQRIHANPAWSYRHGLLVHSWDDPAAVPVTTGCELDCQTDHTEAA